MADASLRGADERRPDRLRPRIPPPAGTAPTAHAAGSLIGAGSRPQEGIFVPRKDRWALHSDSMVERCWDTAAARYEAGYREARTGRPVMKHSKTYGLCATAVAVLLAGALTLGVHNLVLLTLVLMCPLMTFLMVRNMQQR